MDTDKIAQCVCPKCGYTIPSSLGEGCPLCPKCKVKMVSGSNVFEPMK